MKCFKRGIYFFVLWVASATKSDEALIPMNTLPAADPFIRFYWRAGVSSESSISDETFKIQRTASPIVTINSPLECPQIIEPGQSFVIHLGTLPRIRCAWRMEVITKRATTGNDAADAKERCLRLLFNGHPLWRRWFVDGQTKIETFVPTSYLESSDNRLVIENEGTQAVVFYSMSLERFAPGGELLAALTGGHRLCGTVAADVAQTLLRLSPPSGTPPPSDTTGAAQKPVAPRDLNEAIQAARAYAGTPPPAMSTTNGSIVRAEWDAALGAALRRRLLPIVEVRLDTGKLEDWQWFATRYGGMIYAWMIGTQAAGDAIRAQVDGARLYKTPTTTWQMAATDGSAVFLSRNTDILGGRIDRQPGLFRSEYRKKWGTFPVSGVWLHTPPSLQDVITQRRHGEQAAQTMMQWWMSGGNLLILEGGESGSAFFPDYAGHPSSAWESVRLLFGLGLGTSQRTAITVIPDSDGDALSDTYWVAAENGPTLVTALLMPGDNDRKRKIRLLIPVPWYGSTDGVVEGIRFENWRKKDPEIIAAKPLRLSAGDPVIKGDDGGSVDLGLALEGLLRVRLWPTGQTPANRNQQLQNIPATVVPPETLNDVFRSHAGPLPAVARFEILRAANWPAGAMGGAHTSEMRPATRGTLSAEAVTGTFAPAGMAQVRNVVPLEEQSLFVTLQPASATHAFQLFQSGMHTAAGAQAMMFYIRVHVPAMGNLPSGSLQSGLRPVGLWVGNVKRRQRLELIPEHWHQITAPLKGFIRPGEDASSFLLWADDSMRYEMEVELNGFTALYRNGSNGRPLTPVRTAMRRVPESTDMELMLEGSAGAPVVHRIRFERPVKVRQIIAAVPEALPGFTSHYQKESQILELCVDTLPPVAEGLSVADAQARFPLLRADPGLSRVIFRMELEQ